MQPLTYREARAVVLAELRDSRPQLATERVPLAEAAGRVLAVSARMDRDCPPFDRAMRDGFAVRSSSLPGTLRVTGEVRAGTIFRGSVAPGEAVEIMTGAPVPPGADAVVMVEHCRRDPEGMVAIDGALDSGSNISRQGCEAAADALALSAGARLDYAAVSLLAATGQTEVAVYRRPTVAVLATGDELVSVEALPAPHQIRNSNSVSLAAQVLRAGAQPLLLPIARDLLNETKQAIAQGLQADLLLLSGGVSAGSYDVVEPALAELGARFFFDRVRIQPGQPAVFGRVAKTFFFGLPGNPAATMVTFELFARPALDILSGASESALPLAWGRLTRPFSHKPGLTRFLPARLCEGELTPVAWQGSADLPALARANCYLVADADKSEYQQGDFMQVLSK